MFQLILRTTTRCERSHSLLHNDTYNDGFFSIQVPFSISLLSPVKLFFVHVQLASRSQLLQYTSQSQLTWHLMHLQLRDNNYLLHTSHFCDVTFKHFIFLNLLYFHFVPRSSPGMVTSMILTSFLALSITTISPHRASILVSHWIIKSHRILYPLFSITLSGSCSYHCCAP